MSMHEVTPIRRTLVNCVRMFNQIEIDNENQIIVIEEKVTVMVGAYTTSIIILYVLVGLLICFGLKLYFKKNKVHTVNNNAELDQEYLELTMKDNQKNIE